ITDSSSHTLYSKEDATKGKFAFTTEDYDMFEVCFESKSPMGTGRVPDQLVNLDMKHGVEAKNYEEIAKVEKLKPLEVELRRLEDLSESIVNDFAYMKKREEEMRDTNGMPTQYLHRFLFIQNCDMKINVFSYELSKTGSCNLWLWSQRWLFSLHNLGQ
ncbi:Transmembrane emp24 domain-containing protein 10, partial [Ilyodon furcidens]